jgi:hypothetical protein
MPTHVNEAVTLAVGIDDAIIGNTELAVYPYPFSNYVR